MPSIKEAGSIINGNNEVANILGDIFATIAFDRSYIDEFVQRKEKKERRQIQFRPMDQITE